MKTGNPDASTEWVSPAANRRGWSQRRQRVVWSVFYGNFHPRRRTPQRRCDDFGFPSLDWHSPHLMAVAIGILLLSVADAFMTLTLLSGGAIEVNPIMAAVVESPILFASSKMAMTGMGVTLLVFLARYRVLRVLRVEMAIYAILAGYAGLLSYEVWLFRELWWV